MNFKPPNPPKTIKQSTLLLPIDDFTIGYLCGLIDGEGCFGISFCKTKNRKIRYSVQPQFMLHFTESSLEILNFIQKLLNTGSITLDRNLGKLKNDKCKNSYIYRICSINECIELANFLDGKLKIKQKDLEIWKKILYMIKHERHLAKEGLLEIFELRKQMNKTVKKRKIYSPIF